MEEARDPADERLLAELKAALAAARHPQQERLIADGQDAFAFLTVSDEFAALVFDSFAESELEPASRALASERALSFESAELTLDVEITADGIVGQVGPAGPAQVEAEWGDGSRIAVTSDELGSFTLTFERAGAGSGPVRFHVRRDAANAVTDWVSAAR